MTSHRYTQKITEIILDFLVDKDVGNNSLQNTMKNYNYWEFTVEIDEKNINRFLRNLSYKQ